MKIIQLSNGMVSKVDDSDFDKFGNFNWYAVKYRRNWYVAGYMDRTGRGRIPVLLHREIMGNPNGKLIDHKNFDTLNNQRENLREADFYQSNRSRRPNKKRAVISSRFKGVSWVKHLKKWTARILVNGKYLSLGCYREELDAAKAYDAKALKSFGEFAVTNLQLGLL